MINKFVILFQSDSNGEDHPANPLLVPQDVGFDGANPLNIKTFFLVDVSSVIRARYFKENSPRKITSILIGGKNSNSQSECSKIG